MSRRLFHSIRREGDNKVHIAEQEIAALFRLTDRLYRAEVLADSFDAGLDAIRETMGSDRASILLFNVEGAMRFVAWRNISDAYREAVDGHTPWSVGERGAVPIYVSDILRTAEPEWLKERITGEGIRALAFIPLTAKGAVIGKFMLYHAAPHEFSNRENEVALTIARQLGFSIERHVAEQERAQTERNKSLLIDELNHRVKNTLALVRAMARQTFQRDPASDLALRVFDGRLTTLSHAHNLLAASRWEGTTLQQVANAILFDIERVEVAGPTVSLSPKQAVTLAIAFHELQTNAVKYGALSNEAGRVHCSWHYANNGDEPRHLTLQWKETGVLQ